MGNGRKNAYGSWAVVSGASEGMGRAIASELAVDGFNLVLVARRRSRLEALASELESQHRVATRVLGADLGTDEGVRHLLEVTAELDVGLLVAAAGFGTSGTFVENDLGQELDMLAVNCAAVLKLAHHYGRRFVVQGRGGIVLFSSLLAFQGVPRAAHYAATKAYIQSFAEGLRRELAPHGVDVLVAAPGPVASGFAARADMQMGIALRPEAIARTIISALGRKTTVRPGWLSWCLELLLSTVPRWGRTVILSKVMHGFTKHQLLAGSSALRADRSEN